MNVYDTVCHINNFTSRPNVDKRTAFSDKRDIVIVYEAVDRVISHNRTYLELAEDWTGSVL